MIVEENYLQHTSLKKYIKSCSLFTTDDLSKEYEYLLTPSIDKVIYIGINCDFNIIENNIQIKERASHVKKNTTLIIPNQDKTYRVTILGNPTWFSLTFFPLVFTHFTEEHLQNNVALENLLYSKQGISTRMKDIQNTIISHLVTIYKPIERIHPDYILHLLKKGTPIIEIAKQLNISYRTLYRYFKKHSGYSPSLFLRIMRLNLVLQEEEQSISSEVDLHFYDGSHFTRECKYFIGYTPTEFIIHFKNVEGNFYIKTISDHSLQ